MKKLISPFVLALSIASAFAFASVGAFADVVVDEYIEIPQVPEEIVTPRPSLDEVWVPGYWERDPNDWVWVKGRWEKPPHRKAQWRNGHWSREAGKWHWMKGHWAVGDTTWIVDEWFDVPYAYAEVEPPAPSADNHWVPGR